LSHHVPNCDAAKDGINYVAFSHFAIKKIIAKLKTKSAGGPDGIPPIFLKNVASILVSPLVFLYTVFFESTFIPSVWLSAYITPVYKKGDSSLCENYRPISLTCTMCKIMESVIKQQLVNHLLRKGLISKNQHAFVVKHSTVTNLLECVYDWEVSLHSRQPEDTIYVDFSCAFDSVVHAKLIFKLHNLGVGGLLLGWIATFLSNRSQIVVVEHCFSQSSPVKSGVPQGSVLGPVLFILFVNDIAGLGETNDVTLKLFADDLKIYSSISSSTAAAHLQGALSDLESWCELWQMRVNVAKTTVLHLGSNNPKTKYFFNGKDLSFSDEVRDLGISIDVRLSYDKHISNICNKASSRIGVLFRGFATRNLRILRKDYVSYIRPVLEYASPVWCPYLLKYIKAIEKVQRQFTKRISQLSDLSYGERLAALDLETLEIRRLKADLLLYYKIVHNLTPWQANAYFSFADCDHYGTRSNDFRLIKPVCRTNHFGAVFFHRCITCWNELPNDVINSSSVFAFKKNIAKIDLRSYLTLSL